MFCRAAGDRERRAPRLGTRFGRDRRARVPELQSATRTVRRGGSRDPGLAAWSISTLPLDEPQPQFWADSQAPSSRARGQAQHQRRITSTASRLQGQHAVGRVWRHQRFRRVSAGMAGATSLSSRRGELGIETLERNAGSWAAGYSPMSPDTCNGRASRWRPDPPLRGRRLARRVGARRRRGTELHAGDILLLRTGVARLVYLAIDIAGARRRWAQELNRDRSAIQLPGACRRSRGDGRVALGPTAIAAVRRPTNPTAEDASIPP